MMPSIAGHLVPCGLTFSFLNALLSRLICPLVCLRWLWNPFLSSESDAFEKLQYEFWYLRHQDVMLDLRIIGRTLRSVIRRSGR